MSESKVLMKIVWVGSSDRYIYIRRDKVSNLIIELNWSQGDDEESFKACQCNDKELMKFYNVCKENTHWSNMPEITFIDDVIWHWSNLKEAGLIKDKEVVEIKSRKESSAEENNISVIDILRHSKISPYLMGYIVNADFYELTDLLARNNKSFEFLYNQMKIHQGCIDEDDYWNELYNLCSEAIE